MSSSGPPRTLWSSDTINQNPPMAFNFNFAPASQPQQQNTGGFNFGGLQQQQQQQQQQAPTAPAFPGFPTQQGGFGGSPPSTGFGQGVPSFGQPQQQQTPAFGGGGFGGGGAVGFGGGGTTFGASPGVQGFGLPTQQQQQTGAPAFGVSAMQPFGAPAQPAPAFGASFGVFGQPAPSAPTFGATGFGTGGGTFGSGFPQQQQQQQQLQPSFQNPFNNNTAQIQQQSQQQGQEPPDFCIQTGAQDSISSLSFNSTSQYIAAASWDGKVRVWEIQRNGTGGFATAEKWCKDMDGTPQLDVKWSPYDPGRLYTAGCGKAVKLWDLQSDAAMDIGQHSEPVKSLHPCLVGPSSTPVVVTGGWDKKLMYWDPRSPKPALSTLDLPERVFSMDVRDGNMVVATAPSSHNGVSQLHIFDIRSNPVQPVRSVDSALKYQTRCVRIFADGTTYAYATIEGRCRVNCLRQSDDNNKQVGDTGGQNSQPRPLAFAFRCHRSERLIFPVNSIDVHPDPSPAMNPVFATAGADGMVTLWNRFQRMKIKDLFSSQYGTGQGPENIPIPLRLPITDVKFSPDGNTFAYAASYDWSRGAEGLDAQTKAQPPVIYLRNTPPPSLIAKNK